MVDGEIFAENYTSLFKWKWDKGSVLVYLTFLVYCEAQNRSSSLMKYVLKDKI